MTTVALDGLVASMPQHLSPKTINENLTLVRAVLRFMWKRGQLMHVPYVPTQPVPEYRPDWYTEAERDRLLDGIIERYPQWYTFFYLTMRLGLRRGEVYAISKDRIRDIPPHLIVDRAVQEGNSQREAKLIPRKNNRVLTLPLPQDAADAIRWHIREGYSGPEFLFSNRRARTATPISGTARAFVWSSRYSPRRRLMSTSGQRSKATCLQVLVI